MTKRPVTLGNRSGVTAAVAELAEAHEMKMAAVAAERLSVTVRAAFIAGPIGQLGSAEPARGPDGTAGRP